VLEIGGSIYSLDLHLLKQRNVATGWTRGIRRSDATEAARASAFTVGPHSLFASGSVPLSEVDIGSAGESWAEAIMAATRTDEDQQPRAAVEEEEEEDILDEAFMDEAPEHLICPLTKCLLKDPVTTSDGFTYERRAISRWFTTNSTSPMTGKQVPQRLIPNIAIRKALDDFRSKASAKAIAAEVAAAVAPMVARHREGPPPQSQESAEHQPTGASRKRKAPASPECTSDCEVVEGSCVESASSESSNLSARQEREARGGGALVVLEEEDDDGEEATVVASHDCGCTAKAAATPPQADSNAANEEPAALPEGDYASRAPAAPLGHPTIRAHHGSVES